MAVVAIIGSGPAALMAADVLSRSSHQVVIFEKRKAPARKLYIAGGSGLNITNSLPLTQFRQHYTGSPALWQRVLTEFPPQAWLDFIETELELKTFEGTSGRYFVETMHAAKLVRNWRQQLTARGVTWHLGQECKDFSRGTKLDWQLHLADDSSLEVDAICFAMGGGSYEPDEVPLRWPEMFKAKNIGFRDFEPSNVGYQVSWSPAFIAEADGLPLKNIRLHTTRGERVGDCVVTSYGLEGTPVYFVGTTGQASLDLKPDLSAAQIATKLKQVKENLSAIRRIKKQLNLCPASQALLYHHLANVKQDNSVAGDFTALAQLIKNFPLTFEAPQPLSEAISAVGGVSLEEFDETLMLRRFPGVFAAGEMLDWDAPTGGFLIQGCISQGHFAAQNLLRYLGQKFS